MKLLTFFLQDGDLENGGSISQALVDKGPPTSVIVPIYRRDCHNEVNQNCKQTADIKFKQSFFIRFMLEPIVILAEEFIY